MKHRKESVRARFIEEDSENIKILLYIQNRKMEWKKIYLLIPKKELYDV